MIPPTLHSSVDTGAVAAIQGLGPRWAGLFDEQSFNKRQQRFSKKVRKQRDQVRREIFEVEAEPTRAKVQADIDRVQRVLRSGADDERLADLRLRQAQTLERLARALDIESRTDSRVDEDRLAREAIQAFLAWQRETVGKAVAVLKKVL